MLIQVKNITDHEVVLENMNGSTGWLFFPKEIRTISTVDINLAHFWKKIAEKKLEVVKEEKEEEDDDEEKTNRFELMDFD